jgi:hypothetical protein
MAARKKWRVAGERLSFAEYQELVGVNWTTLKHLLKSPAHYSYHLTQPPEDRQTLMLGRAFHTAVLEPDRFPLDYAVYTGGDRRGREWEAFSAANSGRTILKEKEYAEAIRMRDAVRAHRRAAQLLSHGTPELAITWPDPHTSVVCKARLDYLHHPGVVDLKRTASLDARRFANTAADLGYHIQLALYRRGIAALTGVEATEIPVWIVAVEGVPPHDVGVFRVDPGALATGDETVTTLLDTLVRCRRTKRWPGRYPDEVDWHLPGWAYVTEGEDETTAPTMGLQIGGTS